MSLLVCCCHLSEVLCSNFGSIAAWKLLRDVSKVIKLPFYNKPNLFFGFHICIQARLIWAKSKKVPTRFCNRHTAISFVA